MEPYPTLSDTKMAKQTFYNQNKSGRENTVIKEDKSEEEKLHKTVMPPQKSW